AQYTALDEGLIKVVNRCTASDGRRITIEGRARVVDPESNAKLQVTFVQQNGTWIFVPGGDYWILGLDSGYQWAIVGDPDRTGGFILSRNPSLTSYQLVQVVLTLISQGYDPCRFTLTAARGSAQEPQAAILDRVFTTICR
ncbi:MAG: lipocalin family protein, partial [Angustibacter sp.]